MAVDLLVAPHVKWVADMKIQQHVPLPSWEDYKIILPVAGRNSLVAWLILPIHAWFYDTFTGVPPIAPASWLDIFIDLLVFAAVHDTFFYCAHKLMHQPFIYGK